MKKTYVFSMLAVVSMVAYSCTKEADNSSGNLSQGSFESKVVIAVVDENATKTHLDGVEVLWTDGDKITAFDEAFNNYSSNEADIQDGNKRATFTFPEFPAEKDILYAIYPEDGDAYIKEDKVVMQLSSEQPALANSFSEGANLAIAKGDGTDQLQFKNVGAYLSLTINNTDVTHIKLTSSNNMTGEATVDWNNGEPIAVVSPDGSSEVLMDDIQGAGTYYFVVYPGEYEDLKIVFTKDDGQKAIYTNPNVLRLKRNDNLFIGNFDIPDEKWITAKNSFTVSSADVVSKQDYMAYSKTISDTGWIITFGGNNISIGTNNNNRSACKLSSYSKYAVPPVTTSAVATVFANTTPISDVTKIQYTYNGGSNEKNTKVYLLYSEDNVTFSQIDLTAGEQGADIVESDTTFEFEFAECSGYFAVLFVATNTSGAWRIDNVELTFTYTDETGGGTTDPENPDQPEDSVVYTLDTNTSGSNNSYDGNCDMTVKNITWNLQGNSQQQPWRIGGKSITAVDRTLYSKTAIPENISIIEIEHGSSNITVNSAKLIVAKDANFSDVVSTVGLNFTANSTVTASRPDGANWSNCYYKFVYTVTNTTNSNKYFEFKKATFKVQ